MADICSYKEEPQENISTAECYFAYWSLKVIRAVTDCGRIQLHGEDGEGVCAGSSHLWALILPGDVELGLSVGKRCTPWSRVAGLGGQGDWISAAHMSC